MIQAVCVDNISQSKGISQDTPLSQSPLSPTSDKEVAEDKLSGSQPNPEGMKITFRWHTATAQKRWKTDLNFQLMQDKSSEYAPTY